MRSNMTKFDVIIVGAGPGGLRAAEILSKENKKVLLLEKNAEIGPKVCAGGLSRKCFKLLEIDPAFTELSYDGAVFNAPGIRTKLEFGEIFGYTVQRKKLGEWQLQKINQSKVTIKTSAEVEKISGESVVLKNGEEFEYDHLIGADGSNSIVRRHLGLKTKFIGVAFHYLVPQKFPDLEVFFDRKLFGPWYAWIFPYRETTSIGFGCFPKLMSMKVARENFEGWLKKKKIDVTNAKFEAFPINCDYRGIQFGKVFLVGDAAGLTSGFTGEGIYPALVSGEEVARKIIDPKYKMPKIGELRREVALHHFMLVIVFLAGPLRNQLFNLVTWAVRNRFLGRTLARALT